MKNVCFISAPMIADVRWCLRNTSKIDDSSLVTVVMVMLGSCDLMWQPRMGLTLEMLGMDSYSRTPGTGGGGREREGGREGENEKGREGVREGEREGGTEGERE